MLKFSYWLKPFTVVLLLLSFVAVEAQAVNYVVLKKIGKKKRYTFIEGEEITYLRRNDIGFFTDRIVEVQDSALQFASYTLPFSDIEKIHIDKNKHIIPNKTVLMYGANVIIAAAILEVAYRVNSGSGVPDLGKQMLYLTAPVPAFLLVNWVYGLFVKTDYLIAPDEYQLYPVILRQE